MILDNLTGKRQIKIMAMSFLSAAFVPAILYAQPTGSAKNPPNWGQRKEVAWETLKTDFKNPDMIYGPFMFWFWDEPLNVEKMAEMSRVMCSQRFNPGYAHARRSKAGTPDLPDEEWLSDKWFNAFGAALKEAEKENSYLGYCDEYWWPSFQANGRVLKRRPELETLSLNWQVMDVVGGTEVKVPDSFFSVAAQVVGPDGKEPLKEPLLGKWIWHPEAKKDAHTCWFRKVFEIPEGKTIASARIKMTADNSFILHVNGKRIGKSSDWTAVSSFDLATVVSTGNNVLAVEAGNVGGAFGLIAGMLVEFDDGSVQEIRSDKTWLTSLTPPTGDERQTRDATKWTPANEIAEVGSKPWDSIGTIENPVTISSKTLQLIGAGQAFTWKAPPQGVWRVYVFNTFAPGGINVNVIDDRLAEAFIAIALEPYAERMGEKMGRSIPGDFIDHEGDYGRGLAWSGSLARRFKEKYGDDIRRLMPLMLDKDAEGGYAKIRWEWFDTVSDLYAGNFRAVTDWHEKRGMYTTAHFWEGGLFSQVRAVGDHMKMLRALTMPGQDCLGPHALSVHDFKEIESVAEFQNSRAATEFMGAGKFGSTPWGTFTPSFLKRATNAVTAWGMSHIIPHGVFTTRKLVNNPWPPDWYDENPMFPYLHLWTDFARRAGYINSMGCAVPDVLLYNPLESGWINANAGMLDQPGNADRKPIDAINRVYGQAINDLTNARVEFLVADRFYLGQMDIQKAKLVRGEFSFGAIVLPPLDILTLDSARKIVDFARAGGRVYALGDLPAASAENGMHDPAMKELMNALKTLPAFTACPDGLEDRIGKNAPGLESPVKFVSGEFAMLQHRRRIDGKDFFWLANNAEQSQRCDVRIRGVKGAASIWDCQTGQIRLVTSADTPDGSHLTLDFKPLEAYWLVFDPAAPATVVPAEPQFNDVLTVTGPWTVTYDADIQPTMEFPTTPPAAFAAGVEKPLEDWAAWAPKEFSGLMDYTKTIRVDKKEKRMFLDLGKVCYAAQVWVNGKSVGAKLWGPYVFDVSDALRDGDNEIHVRVANLINNIYGEVRPSGLFGPVVLKACTFEK